MKTDQKQYQKEYRARKRADGLKKVELWVPPEVEKKLREYAQTLTQAHKQQNSTIGQK